ncbi:MAG: carboxypeptidase regulatory-like domain-containing protein, partial [Methanobrevibacter sp.]|nr:carboxypeptidase regulatory-like domain-containing protein [Methanobrevibacter sp.]
MYFSNISNVELQQFHNFKMKNFNISLTEMLNSNLFKVETIINDTLYRVFPLFYTDNVKSSNSDDKILDNRCIIAIKKDKETYYSFINNEEDGTIVIYDSSFDFKTIGDQLTDEEFNSIVQLYRSKSFTDNIQIINSLVNGAYADYLFNLESTTIVDNGVLITKETLDNIGTVRLLNPVFKNSEYILHLKVFTVEDFNIDMSDTDNIIVTDLTVPLSVNQEVNIPFETLDLNNIVGFDATVSIAHNQNIIQYPSSLTVSSSTDSPVINKDFELSCVYLDETGEPVNNELITFKSGETVLGTSRTNSDGLAVLEYSASSLGNLVVYCIDNYSNKSNTISVNVVKQTSSVTLETDKSLVYIPGEFTVNGALLVEGEPYHGNVILLNNGTVLDTLEANRYGLFSKTINVTNASNFNLQAKFEDTASISGANSSYVNVVARRLNTNLTIQTNRSTVYFVSQNVTISGVLTDELGNAMSGANVTLNGESSSVTATTNSSGAY